jgi:signal transduction histidine kinase
MMPVVLRDGHSLTVELPSSNPVVSADKDRLRQVVLNLLNNATKFTPPGGKITLMARTDNANLVVEVHDTGLGISKEDQVRLFDPYYRRVEDRERLSGLGLGLALSKKLVELHGGQIWVESEKGIGSTFVFSLPLESTIRKEGLVNPKGKT